MPRILIIECMQEISSFNPVPSGYDSFHVERGEERFMVEWHATDDSVCYEVFAFARPAHPLAKVGSPFVRLVQRRFAADSLRAMAAAVDAEQTR